MAWKIVGGKTVKVADGVEITVEVDSGDETYACPECGKEYKTEAGAEKHLADKHSEE